MEDDDFKLWIPTETQIFEIFNAALDRWGRLSCEPLDFRSVETAQLPTERRLDFQYPREGCLIARCPDGLPILLAEKVYGKNQKAMGREEALQEIMVLFWYRLACHFWKGDPLKFRPAVFKPSRPLDWPEREPDSACIALVRGHPVEIRLWAD